MMDSKARKRALLLGAILGAMLLLPLCGCAASVWDGYDVVAGAEDGSLHAAVVNDAATGAYTLLIGTQQNGTFTETVRNTGAIPADWPADEMTVEVYSGESAGQSWVMVKTKNQLTYESSTVQFMQQETGWELNMLNILRDGLRYYIRKYPDGWYTAYSTDTTDAWAKMPVFSTAIADVDSAAILDLADTALAEKTAREDALFAEQRALLAGTVWVDAGLVKRQCYYSDDTVALTLAVLRTDSATAFCLFSKDNTGAWMAEVNTGILPQDIGADAITFFFPSSGDAGDDLSRFSLSVPDRWDIPYVTFQCDASGAWSVAGVSFFLSETEYWEAVITDGVMQLRPGETVGEEGHIYQRIEPALFAFATFDSSAMLSAMFALYDDFKAGEPPMIPTDGTAYALPQPCGAQLISGTYEVYSGPGRQYYREANGKAAVSANDWVQVFGTDGDWVLIQYRVKGSLLRFGYIRVSALQDPDSVPALTLEQTVLTNTGNEFVTSNPLGEGGQIRFEYSGLTMTRLGTLGDFWLYVELTLPSGQPARMFTEVQPSHG